MKQFSLAKLPGRGMFLAMTIGSVLFISSCKKDSVTEPDPSPTTTQSEATIPDNLANSFSSSASTYKIVAAVNLYNKSNVTISGDSIAGGSKPCIQLTNCSNITITHCKLGHSSSYGILLSNCKNVLIQSNNINRVSSGVLAVSCPNGSIRVLNNQIQNTQGPYPRGAGIQFSGVKGSNNHIDYNRIENVVGQCNPEDKINLYKSYGVSGDPITVTGNLIRGSGTSTTASGVTLGDQGGAYQVAKNNMVVNSGSMGMQVAGGNNIQIINNSIYSSATAWSHMGLGCGNYAGGSFYSITISGNKVNWLSGKTSDQLKGSKTRVMNSSYQAGTAMPSGWSTNVLGAAINSTIVPTALIVFSLFQ